MYYDIWYICEAHKSNDYKWLLIFCRVPSKNLRMDNERKASGAANGNASASSAANDNGGERLSPRRDLVRGIVLGVVQGMAKKATEVVIDIVKNACG